VSSKVSKTERILALYVEVGGDPREVYIVPRHGDENNALIYSVIRHDNGISAEIERMFLDNNEEQTLKLMLRKLARSRRS